MNINTILALSLTLLTLTTVVPAHADVFLPSITLNEALQDEDNLCYYIGFRVIPTIVRAHGFRLDALTFGIEHNTPTLHITISQLDANAAPTHQYNITLHKADIERLHTLLQRNYPHLRQLCTQLMLTPPSHRITP